MNATSIVSVKYVIEDINLPNYLGNPTAAGQDFNVWLKSPAGTYLKLTSPKPFNQNTSSPSGNYCYCPTFTPAGTDGTLPNVDGPYNSTNYAPEGGGLGVVFVGQNPAGTWTLYVNDNVNGQSGGTARIKLFQMTFETFITTYS